MSAWTLRGYQVQATRAISAAWQERDRTAIVMATGTGKTTVFATVARRRRDAKRGRCLVLAHRLELLEQAAERFRLAGMSVEIESGEAKAQIVSLYPSDIVVATIQTMGGRRLQKWPHDAFGTIVIDECHHATSTGYRSVLDYFIGCKVLGVTATPDRGDGVAVGNVIDHLAYEYSLRAAIEDSYLVPLSALAIDTPTVDLSSVRTTNQEHGRDYAPGDLARMMHGEEPMHALARPIIEKSVGRPSLVFVPSVEVAHELARVLTAHLREAGHPPAEALDGGSSKDTRRATLARYQRGETRILVNCALFTEGFDAPSTACVAIARPTKSRALYAQMVGRGTRLSARTAELVRDPRLSAAERRAIIAASDKPGCLILDLAPSNMRHSLVAAVDLLAGRPLPDEEAKAARAAVGGDILAALVKAEEIAHKKEQARARDQGRIVADVRYRAIQRDPFEELGIAVPPDLEKGPRAAASDLELIAAAGIELPAHPSRKQAKAILEAIGERKRKGLCSLKMRRVLATKGLEKDLPFAEARQALDALAATGWKVTPEIEMRWGSGDPADDWERT